MQGDAVHHTVIKRATTLPADREALGQPEWPSYPYMIYHCVDGLLDVWATASENAGRSRER